MQNNTANTLNKASLKKQIHKVKLENKWTKHKATKIQKHELVLLVFQHNIGKFLLI